MTDGPYHPDWYSSHQGLARSSAQVVVPLVMEWVAPRSVVDVGCGTGEWLITFSQAGVERILGLDGAYVRQANLQIPARDFREADLTQPLTVTDRFDLAVCLEVAEHLPPAAGPQLIQQLTRLAPVVLFSAAIPRQGGQDHQNEQWPEFWQAQFDQAGYVAVDCLRSRLWEAPAVAWYYSQNMILYVQRDRMPQYLRLTGDALPPPAKLRRLVHPDRFLTTANLKCFSLGQVLRALPELVARSVAMRWQRWTQRKRP